MDEVTQQNAALVEEAAAAAESMQEQAQVLTQAVSVFRLSGGSDSGVAKPIKRSSNNVTKLPNRGPATKKKIAAEPAENSATEQDSPRGKKAAGGDDWEEF